MKNEKKPEPKTQNDNYTDGFPIEDNNKKMDDTSSKDSSRPFDSARRNAYSKNYNPTGTNMNEKDSLQNK
ncbi:MAG: hypothetical protein H7336_07790 [Bacteriovorax sp.]|nr:hypothetical protein [Bacteriovorax sp.]